LFAAGGDSALINLSKKMVTPNKFYLEVSPFYLKELRRFMSTAIYMET